MITYKIHLIRTGRTSTNGEKRYVGQSDIPLCPEGAEQLEHLREAMRYPEAGLVYTSPLTRCRQTAEILYPHVEHRPVEDLQDMNLGAFEGCTFEELKGDTDFTNWISNSFEYAPPGGEESGAFAQRVVQSLNAIFLQMVEERTTSAAVITHAGVIMTLLSAVGLPKLPLPQWAVDNGTGYTLAMTTQMWMRDRAGEVLYFIPDSPEQGGEDLSEESQDG